MSSDETPWRDAAGWWTISREVRGHPRYQFQLYYKNYYASNAERGKHLDYQVAADYRDQGDLTYLPESAGLLSYKHVKHLLKITGRHDSLVAKEPHIEKNYDKFTPVYKALRKSRVASIANARFMQLPFYADAALQDHLNAAAHKLEFDPAVKEYEYKNIANVEEEIPIGTPLIMELELRCNRPLDGNIRARLQERGPNTYAPDLIDPLEIEVYREVAKARLINTRTGTFVRGWVPYNNESYNLLISGLRQDKVRLGVPKFVTWTGPFQQLLVDQAQQPPKYNFLGLDAQAVRFGPQPHRYSILPPLRNPAQAATIVAGGLFTYDDERRMEKLSLADAALALRVLQKRQREAAEDMYRPGAVMERLNKQRLEEAMRLKEDMGEEAACVPNLSALRL